MAKPTGALGHLDAATVTSCLANPLHAPWIAVTLRVSLRVQRTGAPETRLVGRTPSRRGSECDIWLNALAASTDASAISKATMARRRSTTQEGVQARRRLPEPAASACGNSLCILGSPEHEVDCVERRVSSTALGRSRPSHALPPSRTFAGVRSPWRRTVAGVFSARRIGAGVPVRIARVGSARRVRAGARRTFFPSRRGRRCAPRPTSYVGSGSPSR